LRKEKSELLLQVEQEEEYLTNTLQKKLNQVRLRCAAFEIPGILTPWRLVAQLQKEKIDMENALEQEQEYIVNRLQKQLDSLRQQQQHTHTHSHQSRENSASSSLSSTPLLPPPSPSSS
jgi:DNA-directed RNA polymerase subunit L